MKDELMKLSMKDTARNSLIAVPIVILFELYMIISWFFSMDDKSSLGARAYLIGYVSLLAVSILILTFILFARKDIDKNWKKINVMQHVYSVAFVLWALAITFVGAKYRGNFDYLIYLTIVTIVPVFCYLNWIFWSALHLVSSAFVIYIASSEPHFHSFLINFLVFTIISILASAAMYLIRRTAYKREIQLEREAKRSFKYAYIDTLTELPNRRSYLDMINKLESKPKSDLIVAMFDINGLKHVNDKIGHEAGDQLISGAAKCLKEAFLKMGSVYRVGGDEFTGILHGSKEELQDAINALHELTKNYKTELIDEVSISVGYAFLVDNPDETIEGLEIIADRKMYQDKDEFYKTSSVSRRL